jgi:anaerobic magnesium-protoporphyrin IX monomethyl ester cyclase
MSTTVSMKRLALIFPPGIHPGSPPLGLAQLKSFLTQRGCFEEIGLFDLNLAHYEQALQWLEEGRLKMRLQGRDAPTSARLVSEVCRLFKSPQSLDRFLDLEVYNTSASLYRSFESVLNGLFDNFARKVLLDLRVTGLAESYFSELLRPVTEFAPDLAGFSLLFSQQLYFALALAKVLKPLGTKVVLGGATLAVMPSPERLLSERISIEVDGKPHGLDLRGLLDYLIVGEGEASLAALGEHLPGDLSSVPGLIHVKAGEVVSNPPGMVDNLNELPPPDFGDFPLQDYHSPLPILPYLSARGCFRGRCSFCTHRKTYLAYREESVGQTVQRLAQLQATYGLHLFHFVDEMIHPYRFGLLSRALDEHGLRLKYSAYAKPVGRFDGPLLERLYHSGARVIMWGVESGSQRVLDAMGKGTRVVQIDRVLSAAHGAGIWNLVFLMFGFPSETDAEWEDTLRFIEKRRNSIDALSKSMFVLLPGSGIFKNPASYGITRIVDRPHRDPVSVAYDYEVCRGLSQDEVKDLYQRQLPALRDYGRSPYFGLYRDHMLIHAACAAV